MGETKMDASAPLLVLSQLDTESKVEIRIGPIKMSEETTNVSTFDALTDPLGWLN
jgi:hypothetical protein